MRRSSRHLKPILHSPRSKRGASYIMSVMAMIMVTASLAGAVMLWGMNVVGESNVSFSSALDAKYERGEENLVIEDVKFVNSTAINVHLRNAGSGLLVVDKIYVNYNLAESSRLILDEQGHGTVTATNFGFSLVQGEAYNILLVTTRGTKASGDYINTGS